MISKDYLKQLIQEFDNNVLKENIEAEENILFFINMISLLIALEIDESKLTFYYQELKDINYDGIEKLEAIYNNFLNKETNFEDLQAMILPILKETFKVLSAYHYQNFEKDIKQKFINIINNWSLYINNNELPNTKFYTSIINEINSYTKENLWQVIPNNQSVMREKINLKDDNYIPVQITKLGSSCYKQEYFNATPRYKTYIGANIENKNSNYKVNYLEVVMTFYKDKMVIDKIKDTIEVIEPNQTLHYACNCYVDEEYDDYSLKIIDGNYISTSDNINIESKFPVTNLNYKINPEEHTTKVSCHIKNNTDQKFHAINVYIHFLKEDNIIAGLKLYEYDIYPNQEYNLIGEIPLEIECDEIKYSQVPIY